MDTANFTTDRVAKFKCKRGMLQSIYWDGKTPGFGMRVTASGATSYIFECEAPRLGKCRKNRTHINDRQSKSVEEEMFSHASADR